MNERYLQPIEHARWAIGRTIAGKRVYLVQNSPLDCIEDIALIFQVLGIDLTLENTDRYFPTKGMHGRCPTLDLLELFSTINRVGVPLKNEVGV